MGFLDLLDPSNDPEFFWQVISGPPCIMNEIQNYSFICQIDKFISIKNRNDESK
jgi:hypothetical protein